jgi:hypothetical protein
MMKQGILYKMSRLAVPIRIEEERVMPAIKTATRKNARSHSRRMAKKVTLDDVWAGFAELREIHAETEKGMQEFRDSQQKAHAETEAAIKETQKGLQELKDAQKETQKAHAETEAAIKETQKAHAETEVAIKETQKALKETQRVVGDLGNKFGEDAEHTLIPGLPEKLKPAGFNFGSISRKRKINDDEHNIRAEVDAFLENGTQMMAVEVKAKLHRADVDGHIRRMEKIRAYADLHGDKRDLFGALAATVVTDEERNYALKKGLFVIEPSGEDITVTEPAVSPRVWQAKDKG